MTFTTLEERDSSKEWWKRPTLSRRLAVTLILSLVALQVQAFVQIRLFSNPEFRLVGTRWLAEEVRAATLAAFAVPAEQRSGVVAELNAQAVVRHQWSATSGPSEPDDGDTLLAARLRATLADVFGTNQPRIHIAAATVSYRFPSNVVRLTITPEVMSGPLSSGPVKAGEPDVAMPAGARIWVQGADGTWLMIEAVGFADSAMGFLLPYAPLLLGGLIIALASTLTARHIVAPLDRLVVAAERIGTAREAVRVDATGLREFASVARAFEDMQQRLLRFVEDRTRILAAISHDLRTSLTRLRLAAEQCQGSDERLAVSNEIDDMQAMLDSTLAFASGEARLSPNQATDIAALVISLVDETADLGKDCCYSGPDHVETMAHPVSLKRALRNVIDNALKYGQRARVALSVDSEHIKITVDDDGPGIPIDQLEDVFAPFRRLDPSRSHETPGVGLGLTIARDVVQSHGGTINLKNRIAGGLEVILALPLRRSV